LKKHFIFDKAFVCLDYGKNEITLTTDDCLIKIVLYRYLMCQNYYPIQNEIPQFQVNNKMIRVLYVVCKDDPTNGEFQSQNTDQNKLENALNRISLNVELLQTFISETMFKKFKSRKTFALKNDFFKMDHKNGDGNLVCETFYTNLELNKALTMQENEIFLYLACEIKQDKGLFDKDTKYLAILSFTRYKRSSDSNGSNDIFRDTHGYCALGKILPIH
jgi:hypothetical protein